MNRQDLLANPSVAARIAELKAENAQECKMTRKEALNWLVDVIRTGAGKIHKDDALCKGYKDTEDCTEIRMPNKLAAICAAC